MIDVEFAIYLTRDRILFLICFMCEKQVKIKKRKKSCLTIKK